MLAIKDRPTDAKEFLKVVESEDVAQKENRKRSGDIMYRDGASFRWLYEKAMATSREEILKLSVIGKKLAKKNTCSSGECSPFGEIHEEQQDLFRQPTGGNTKCYSIVIVYCYKNHDLYKNSVLYKTLNINHYSATKTNKDNK